ncbi:MAG: hypothetical protein ACXACY_10405 [Candidatus Hodarchaeales archaeon]|jgi:uncharacterized Zn finger protein (UPF0148 family)
MLLDCTVRGCLQTTEAKLDRETGEVICDACGNNIPNVTPYIKKALNSVGQVIRSRIKKPFQVMCPQCKTHRSLFVKNDQAFCRACGTQVAISAAFLHGLKLHLSSNNEQQDI